MKLPFMMGTELTGIHRSYNAAFNNESNYILDDVAWIRERLDSINTRFDGLHTDDGCIEISSLKLRTFEQYENFSKQIRSILAEKNYFPKCEVAVCGGAHIHVNMRWNKEFSYFLCRDLVMRPYLPWIFGEPDEREAMDVYINKKNDVDLFKGAIGKHYRSVWREFNEHDYVWNNKYLYEARFLYHLMKPYNNKTLYSEYSDDTGKGHMFRLSKFYKTLEFRFFEMTPTWEEQKLQMEFLCAYLKWMEKRFKKGIITRVKLMRDCEMQKIRPIQCVRKFHRLCSDIGVNFEDYMPFIKRNLYPRWKNGRKRR